MNGAMIKTLAVACALAVSGTAMAHARRIGFDIRPEHAIRWLTANPAHALGIDAQTGTLEPGKMGDAVLWNGTPFSVYAHADKVWIDGALMYDRNDRSRQPQSDFLLGQSGSEPAGSEPAGSEPGVSP